MADCPFCHDGVLLADGTRLENDLAYVREDKFPVSPGHLLIIPRRHALDWFDLSADEQAAVAELINEGKAWLAQRHQPDGYNIGMNCGEAAGQTVMHMHCHLIPRYAGDVQDPRGGLRGIIPGKQKYGDNNNNGT